MSEFAGNRRLDTTQMTTIDKQLKDLVAAGAMIVVPQVQHPIGIGYVRVIDKTVRWSIPYPDNQSDVHEFNFSEVEIKGPHIIFTTDRGKVYVSAVDEWVPEHVGDFVDVKANWDTLLKDPKIKESYYRFIEEDAL